MGLGRREAPDARRRVVRLAGGLFTILAGRVQGTLYAIVVYLVRGKLEEPEAVKAERAELEKAAAEGDEEAKEILDEDPLGKPPEEGFAQRADPVRAVLDPRGARVSLRRGADPALRQDDLLNARASSRR